MIDPLGAIRRTPHRTWLRYRFVFLALAPIMALFLYLRILPTAQAIFMSLWDWELIAPAKDFVGLDNYVNLLSDRNFREALLNTTVFAVVTYLRLLAPPLTVPSNADGRRTTCRLTPPVLWNEIFERAGRAGPMSEHRSEARSAAPMWQGGAPAEERGTVHR